MLTKSKTLVFSICTGSIFDKKGGNVNERDCIFLSVKNIAAATAKTFGRNCEVAIHDFERLQHSLIQD